MNTNLTSGANRQRAAAHERTRRAPGSKEVNARDAQARHGKLLTDARAIKGERGAALAEILERIVDDGRAALARYESYVEILGEAEANYRAALAASHAAEAEHVAGSLDAETAVRLFAADQAAKSALRVRDRELSEAQRPAGVPELKLPREAEATDTRDLALIVSTYGCDLGGSSARPLQDAVRMASDQAESATHSQASWWILHEADILEEQGDVEIDRRRGRKREDHLEIRAEVKAEFEKLRELFEMRWRLYSEAQARKAVSK